MPSNLSQLLFKPSPPEGNCPLTNATRTRPSCPASTTCFSSELIESVICFFLVFEFECLPRLSTALFKTGERFVVGVVGVHYAGPKRALDALLQSRWWAKEFGVAWFVVQFPEPATSPAVKVRTSSV